MIINPFAFNASASYDSEVLADSPWSYHLFAETSGTVAADAVGGRPLTYTNGPLLNQKNLADTGASVYTDGINDYITGQYSSAINAAFSGDKAVTMECIIEPQAAIARGGLMHLGNFSSNPGHGPWMQMMANGSIQVAGFVGSGYFQMDSAAGVLTANTRAHVAFRRNSSGASAIILNGVAIASATIGGIGNGFNLPVSPAYPLNIMVGAGAGVAGSGNPAFFLKSYVARPAFYTSALSDARLLAHATAAGL